MPGAIPSVSPAGHGDGTTRVPTRRRGPALVKGLVETHGGTIDVASGGKGKGTELVVRLPLATAPVRLEVAPPAVPRPRRILVIEDNPDAGESLRLALELQGHEVFLAHAGFDVHLTKPATVEAVEEVMGRARPPAPREPAPGDHGSSPDGLASSR